MKIITLIEDTLGEDLSLIREHGLSIFIETPYGNILFDTGQSNNLIKNAKTLNIDLNSIKYIILSHAHYDHSNGLKPLLDSITSKPSLYVSKYFFNNQGKYYETQLKNSVDASQNKQLKYIGVNFHKEFILNKGITINYITDNSLNLTPNITIHTNFHKNCSFETINKNMKVKLNDTIVLDSFKDEVALSIDTKKGLLILVGCSHPGIINILETIRRRSNRNIYGVIGGTHLIEADESRIERTIEYFNDMNIELIGVSHCTGNKAIEQFKRQSKNFFINSTGKVLDISDITT